MKNQIQELINLINSASVEEAQDCRVNFDQLNLAISNKIHQVKQWQEEVTRQKKLALMQETQFKEPQFYALDEDENESDIQGTVNLSSLGQAELLLKLLNTHWQYHYVLPEWQGPGVYAIIPSSEYRCGDTEYTGTLKKQG